MDNLEFVVGLVLAVVTIIGTILGVLLPMINKIDNKFERKFEIVDAKLERLSSQIIDIHKDIAALYRRLPAEPELMVARR
jgi:hypothetical protein